MVPDSDVPRISFWGYKFNSDYWYIFTRLGTCDTCCPVLWDTMHGNFEGVNTFITPLGTPLVPCPIQHCRWVAHLPSLGVWAHSRVYNRACDPWPLRHQTYDYLPSQRPMPLQPLGWPHSHPGRSGEDKRLSSPEWLVTYQDSIPSKSHPSQ